MPEEITIRSAQPGDLPAILALLDENQLPKDGLADHIGSTLIASMGGALAGSAALELYGSYALLRSVSIRPQVQRHGVGQRLIRAALALAEQRGAVQVFLLTETAATYFPRFGFAPISRSDVPATVQQSVEFTTACPQSALVMSLHLAAQAG